VGEFDVVHVERDVSKREDLGLLLLWLWDLEVFAQPACKEKGAYDELGRCLLHFGCVCLRN
jgi:hypothetical protein